MDTKYSVLNSVTKLNMLNLNGNNKDDQNIVIDNHSLTNLDIDLNAQPLSQLCRICATINSHFISIFHAEGSEHKLCEKIHKHLPITISETDTLPLQVCYNCAATILAWDELSEGCLIAQHHLKQLQANHERKRLLSESDSIDNSKLSQISQMSTKDGTTSLDGIEISVEQIRDTDVKEVLATLKSNRFDKVHTSLKTHLNIQNPSTKISQKSNSSLCSNNTDLEDTESNWSTIRKSTVNKCGNNLVEIIEDNTSKVKDEESETEEEKCENNSFPTNEETISNKRKSKADKKEMNTNQDTYRCEECGRAFKLKDSFQRHMRIHKNERPYTCHVCGKQFRDSGGLSRHLKDVHAKLKKFSCDICNRSFASKATRDDHHRTHTGERPYVCDSCGKTFKSKASLYIHSKLHTDEFPHPCTYCDKKFRRRHEMLAHVTTHTGEKNHSCDICNKRFRVKSELVRHKLVHSKDKPFICNLCGLAFRQKRYMNSHLKNRHVNTNKQS